MAQQKRSNNLIIILGLATAVLGGGLVLLLLSRGGDETAAPTGGGDMVPVLVSKRAIAQGTRGDQLGDAVEVKQVPAATRSADALVSLGELSERTTSIDITPDQQLRSAFFRQRTARGEALKVPEGKQAVAMTIPFTNAGGGYVGPGDRINLYALVGRQNGVVVPLCQDQEEKNLCTVSSDPKAAQAASQLVLSNIEVLDVSQEVAPATVSGGQPAAAQPATAGQPAVARGLGAQPTLTYLMAVDAAQAEKAIFFSRFGEVYLTLVPTGQPDAATTGRDQTNALKP
ncbi:MAG: RcpC/CpaB family pilus assembly protein [Acidimicrobiales bacterium]